METNLHRLTISRPILLRKKHISDKVVEHINTHVLCSIIFFSKIVPFMR